MVEQHITEIGNEIIVLTDRIFIMAERVTALQSL